MGRIENFYDLEAWKQAHDFVMGVYELTKVFPKEERFELIAQLRSAATSIAANIAEGFGRYHYKDKQKFYYNARGSCYESQSHLMISKSLQYSGSGEIEGLIQKSNNVARLINGLIRSVGQG